jgi:hypothetical protein
MMSARVATLEVLETLVAVSVWLHVDVDRDHGRGQSPAPLGEGPAASPRLDDDRVARGVLKTMGGEGRLVGSDRKDSETVVGVRPGPRESIAHHVSLLLLPDRSRQRVVAPDALTLAI